MLKSLQQSQHNVTYEGSNGLPAHYPIPQDIDDMLFYIQRNLNENTVVYKLNRSNEGVLNLSEPVQAFWIKYTEGGIHEQLNYIQEKLAYGYHCKIINNETVELQIVSYPSFRIFISKTEAGKFKAYYKSEGRFVILNNIYVYAEDFGVFPDVKFVDIHGYDQETKKILLDKLNIND